MSIFLPAKRENTVPLIGLFGKSGSGKTLSALRLARGLVGPKGRIGITDTENRRATHFVGDPIVGEYGIQDLQPPFSPESYVQSFEAAQNEIDCWVCDSASHEWNGPGGCLEIFEEFLNGKAGNDFKLRDKWKMAAWAHVSPRHERFVQMLMRSRIPVILCFRAKDKVVMEKAETPGARTEITKDEDAPISRKDLIYEMTLAYELHEQEVGDQKDGGFYSIRKKGPPSLFRVLSAIQEERLGLKHGEAIAHWCKTPSAGMAGLKATIEDPKRTLWNATRFIHEVPVTNKDDAVTQAGRKKLQQWLWDEGILSDTESLSELAPARFPDVIAKAAAKVEEQRKAAEQTKK